MVFMGGQQNRKKEEANHVLNDRPVAKLKSPFLDSSPAGEIPSSTATIHGSTHLVLLFL